MHNPSEWSLTAGVVVTLAFFALVAHIVRLLRTDERLPRVIIAVFVLVGALPAILLTLYEALGGSA